MQKQQLFLILFHGKMKLFLLLIILNFGFACSTKIVPEKTLSNRSFISRGNLAYGGQDRFIFLDNTFIYYGTGPAKIISKGQWIYIDAQREIGLKTDNSLKPEIKNPIDTIWADLSGKNIKVISKKKIMFDDIIYYTQ